MEFEWDERKAKSNLAKHGIPFEAATAVFEDPLQLREPNRLVGTERRLQVIGLAMGTQLVLFVVYTVRFDAQGNPLIRIISARRASRKERARYGGT